MEDLFIYIYLFITFPMWVFVTLAWIIIKTIWYGFLWILKILVSIFSSNQFDIYSFFYDFLGPVIKDYDKIFDWFKKTYYDNSLLALILVIFCILFFWSMGQKKN